MLPTLSKTEIVETILKVLPENDQPPRNPEGDPVGGRVLLSQTCAQRVREMSTPRIAAAASFIMDPGGQ